ncbi:hypothetical protein NPIL_346541 [Nephila pilipes]|uniref:Uncharacterized protein n=1 Tax=Nephila pilipes TaxID=299642 RepID=A0A8X6MZB0_NEPPI|nr:hypothetical protein NPIL_346541 [Nephila pilipes]
MLHPLQNYTLFLHQEGTPYREEHKKRLKSKNQKGRFCFSFIAGHSGAQVMYCLVYNYCCPYRYLKNSATGANVFLVAVVKNNKGFYNEKKATELESRKSN